jgi:hypothetical protein
MLKGKEINNIVGWLMKYLFLEMCVQTYSYVILVTICI